MCPSTVEICITVPLSYSSITAKQIKVKESLLLTCKILELLVNTLAVHEMYLVLHRENLTIPIQMQLSKQQKIVSKLFATSLKSRRNFERFEKKMTLVACVFLKLRTLKRSQINV